jgi:hypothetical protein
VLDPSGSRRGWAPGGHQGLGRSRRPNGLPCRRPQRPPGFLRESLVRFVGLPLTPSGQGERLSVSLLESLEAFGGQGRSGLGTPLRPAIAGGLGAKGPRRHHPNRSGSIGHMGPPRSIGSRGALWVRSSGPAQSLTTKPCPLRPLGQVGDGEVDRAARAPKGQRGGGIRCPPRRRVSFSADHPWPCPLQRFQDAIKARCCS